MKIYCIILLALFPISSFAKFPTMKLGCAKVAGYKTEAERQYLSKSSGGGDIYNLNITFVTKRPDNKLVDNVLRECLEISIKLDDKKDILASAWFRPIDGADPNDDEKIDPYGTAQYIVYSAKTKRIEVKKLGDGKN